jgi:hypothetical protein
MVAPFFIMRRKLSLIQQTWAFTIVLLLLGCIPSKELSSPYIATNQLPDATLNVEPMATTVILVSTIQPTATLSPSPTSTKAPPETKTLTPSFTLTPEVARITYTNMVDWNIPIAAEILEALNGTKDVPKKFEPIYYSGGFAGGVGFKFVWGGKVSTESFDVTAKDGTVLAKALAWDIGYYFDANGKPAAVVLPMVWQLPNGRVVQNNWSIDVPWGKGWEDFKKNDSKRYESVFNHSLGQVGKTIIPLEYPVNKRIIDKNSPMSVAAFVSSVAYPYDDSWRSELVEIVELGKSPNLKVLVDHTVR